METIMMKNRNYPGRLNKRARKSYGIYAKLAELQMLAACAKTIRYVMKKKCNTDIYPGILKLQTHTDCNGECIICPHRYIRRIFPRNKMDMELYKKIVLDFTSNNKARDFCLSLHNEPLMDDTIFAKLSFFQENNIYGIPCVISTNGTLLTKEICSKLIKSGVDIMQISVNGSNKSDYEMISGGKNYEELMSNINYFLMQDLSEIGVIISFVSIAQFKKERKHAMKKWRKLGITVMVHHLSNRGGALKDYDKYVILNKKMFSVREIINALIHSVVPCCPYPFHQMCILSDGRAILCSHDWERKTIIGDLNKQTIHEIWNSDKLNEIRLKIIAGRYDEIAACKECSVYKTYTRI
jgi:radical SAM protein with 4Fe4S-binding SPASM domain